VPGDGKGKAVHILGVFGRWAANAVQGNTQYHAAIGAVGGSEGPPWRWEVAPFGVKVCHTWSREIGHWARRAGQNAPDLLTEYEATVGSFLKILRGLEGACEGDQRKIAEVIVATGE